MALFYFRVTRPQQLELGFPSMHVQLLSRPEANRSVSHWILIGIFLASVLVE